MNMSTNVVGFKPPDEKWKKMKAVYDACVSAGLDVPSEVDKFFDFSPPDDVWVEVPQKDLPIKVWAREMASGYELDVTKLDPDIKVVRFFNRW